MRRFRVVIVIFMVSVSSSPGCREPPDPPSQEAVDMAWQRADQAVVSAERARNEARQAGRLRDIDRLRAETERDELASQVSVLRGVALALSLLLLVALPWLAVEVRRRRMWAHAGDQVRRQIGVTLRDLQYALSHCERAVREVTPNLPTLRLVHEELCQLFDEFDGCCLDTQAGVLSVVTDPMVLEGLHLGPFRIEIELAQLEVNDPARWLKVVALSPNPATCDEAVTHPHVRDDRLCTGDAAMAIPNALRDGRICDVLMMVRSILSTYNAHSPFVRTEDWDGRACYDCGAIADADSAFFCEHCDHDYCDDCTSYCRRCDETRCRSCLSDCPICCDSCCGSCLSSCQRCRMSACPDCMEEGICQPCLSGENEEPDFDETLDKPVEQEGTGQPIQAEQTGDTRLVTSSKQVL